jgi:3-mercaptopyruvate sulfurtransferase SseA
MQQVSTEDAVRSSYLITSEELATKLTEGNANLKIVNGTWYMPAAGKNAFEEHQAKRISQDAVYFDIDEIRVKSSDFPRMIPTVEFFIENMKKLGITKDSEVVCYDVQGMFSVARTEFMLRYFGHENVRILDGGLTKWIAEGRPTFEGEQVRYGVATENDTGNYDYKVVDSTRVLKDVNHMHDYARQLYKSADGKI